MKVVVDHGKVRLVKGDRCPRLHMNASNLQFDLPTCPSILQIRSVQPFIGLGMNLTIGIVHHDGLHPIRLM